MAALAPELPGGTDLVARGAEALRRGFERVAAGVAGLVSAITVEQSIEPTAYGTTLAEQPLSPLLEASLPGQNAGQLPDMAIMLADKKPAKGKAAKVTKVPPEDPQVVRERDGVEKEPVRPRGRPAYAPGDVSGRGRTRHTDKDDS